MRIPPTVCAGVPLPPIPGGEDRPANNIRWPLISPSPDPSPFLLRSRVLTRTVSRFPSSALFHSSTTHELSICSCSAIHLPFTRCAAGLPVTPTPCAPICPLKLQAMHHGCLSITPIIVPARMQNLAPFPIPPFRRRSSLASKIPTNAPYPIPPHPIKTRDTKKWDCRIRPHKASNPSVPHSPSSTSRHATEPWPGRGDRRRDLRRVDSLT